MNKEIQTMVDDDAVAPEIPLSPMIEEAIQFAAIAHAGQTRKGKDVPYITHLMGVAELLSSVDAPEEVITAGILHDSIEDTTVTYIDLTEQFGTDVADMVNDVTEQDKSLSWAERKQAALDHITDMGEGSLLVKTADVLHNMTEQLADYKVEGDVMFDRFKAGKDAQLDRYTKLVALLDARWPENPLLPRLKEKFAEVSALWS